MNLQAANAGPLTVTVVVPVRNERARLPAVIENIEAQTLSATQVVVVDGDSSDGSREWLEEAGRTRPWLRVVDNPERIIPSAMNRGVLAASSQIVARMDAHVDYHADYLEQLVRCLADRPEVAGAGGALETVGRGPWGSAIAPVLRSRWGLGGAMHRIPGAGGPVEHNSCTAYRRSAVLEVGGWDRSLLANEDVELDHRVSLAVGPLWLVPEARSTWWVRESPGALARQMWRYGFYRARTAHLRPATFKLRHAAPVTVVGGIPLLALISRKWGGAGALGYLMLSGTVGAVVARRDGASGLRGAAAVPIVHLAWGSGFLVGGLRHWGARPEPGF